MMAMRVQRLEVALGAEVTGVDLSRPLDGEAAQELRIALYEHQVLILRGQHLSPEQHVAAAAIFGTPRPSEPAGFLGVTDPVQTFVRDVRRAQTADQWHTDTPFMADPPVVGMLTAIRPPQLGGDTAWCSLYSIYDDLSPGLRALCEAAQGEHSMRSIRGLIRDRIGLSPERMLALDDAFPDRLHPLVQRHRVTGRPLIFDGGEWMERLVGLPADEAAMLRRFLRSRIDKIEYQFRWRWTAGDVAIWDEQSTNHIGLSDHHLVDPNRTMRTVFVYRPDEASVV